ncbi:MAG: hypothetical protein NTW11_01130 [Candidatus Staskawiczbacteria bacterium]|nr:hypothetical protein [Candidatus Staskawiczbacteria bacterium]
MRLDQLLSVGDYFRKAGLAGDDERDIVDTSGWNMKNKTVGVRVFVPSGNHGGRSNYEIFWEEMGKFGVTKKNIRHAEAVTLRCPPAPEPCTDDGYLGTCSICGEEHPVIGPIGAERKFLMGRHTPHGDDSSLCSGTSALPNGEVRRK